MSRTEIHQLCSARRVQPQGLDGYWDWVCSFVGFYGRHALPVLELYREKKHGWRIGAASNLAGNVEE